MVKIPLEVSAVKSEVLRRSDWVNLGTSRPFSLSSLVTSIQTGKHLLGDLLFLHAQLTVSIAIVLIHCPTDEFRCCFDDKIGFSCLVVAAVRYF